MEPSPLSPDHDQENSCPQISPGEQHTDTLFIQARNAVVALGSMLAYAFRSPVESYQGVAPTLHELTMGLMGSSFQPDRDIVDLTGKVIFVTGGNTGLGKEAILQLARHGPSRIYMGARDERKARDAITSIQSTLSSSVDIRHVPLDLSSFDSTRTASEIFTSECDRLDILMLNAGTLGNQAVTTEAGHEIQFGTNHVGHFLLAKLLLPTLLNTAALSPSPDVRVVTLASIASGTSPPFDIMTSATRLMAETTWHRYAASKAANILFASELARRHPNIMSVSVHPGVVKSDLYDQAKTTSLLRYPLQVVGLTMRSVRTGALNQLWAAGADRELLENGAYYTPIGVIRRNNEYVVDVALGKKLWDWTDAEVRKFGF